MIDEPQQAALGDVSRVGETTPLVSVGLPTYNRASSLRRAVDSVLAQDYSNLELIISDNASSDQTASFCEEYATGDVRVRYVRQDVNRGAHNNFATVLDRAVGKYFMWLGDDDWLDKSYLSRCVSVLRARPDVSLVCGVPTYVEDGRRVAEGVKIDVQQESPSARVVAFYNQVSDNGTFYGVARRDVLLENPAPAVLAGDWLMIASLAFLGKIVTIDDIAVFRSSRGVSADVRLLARQLGLSEKEARQPHRSIASNVARDIARNSRAFHNLNVVSRWILAEKCAIAVHRRFVEVDDPITAITRWGRTTLKQLLHLA